MLTSLLVWIVFAVELLFNQFTEVAHASCSSEAADRAIADTFEDPLQQEIVTEAIERVVLPREINHLAGRVTYSDLKPGDIVQHITQGPLRVLQINRVNQTVEFDILFPRHNAFVRTENISQSFEAWYRPKITYSWNDNVREFEVATWGSPAQRAISNHRLRKLLRATPDLFPGDHIEYEVFWRALGELNHRSQKSEILRNRYNRYLKELDSDAPDIFVLTHPRREFREADHRLIVELARRTYEETGEDLVRSSLLRSRVRLADTDGLRQAERLNEATELLWSDGLSILGAKNTESKNLVLFRYDAPGPDQNITNYGEFIRGLKKGELSQMNPRLKEATVQLTDKLKAHPSLSNIDVIIPVPSSTRSGTGLPQVFAEVLTETIGQNSKIQSIGLRTERVQKSFHGLYERLQHAVSHFNLGNPNVRGKRVLILDDIADSEATVEALRMQLLDMGAESVEVANLSRICRPGRETCKHLAETSLEEIKKLPSRSTRTLNQEHVLAAAQLNSPAKVGDLLFENGTVPVEIVRIDLDSGTVDIRGLGAQKVRKGLPISEVGKNFTKTITPDGLAILENTASKWISTWPFGGDPHDLVTISVALQQIQAMAKKFPDKAEIFRKALAAAFPNGSADYNDLLAALVEKKGPPSLYQGGLFRKLALFIFEFERMSKVDVIEMALKNLPPNSRVLVNVIVTRIVSTNSGHSTVRFLADPTATAVYWNPSVLMLPAWIPNLGSMLAPGGKSPLQIEQYYRLRMATDGTRSLRKYLPSGQ